MHLGGLWLPTLGFGLEVDDLAAGGFAVGKGDGEVVGGRRGQ
jgi:hypothetical protein